jgi:hypothetical protein
MPYKVGWLLENKIILVVGSGVFTIEDSLGNMREAAALAEQAAPILLHGIINMLDVTKQPSLAEQFSTRHQVIVPPNHGWTIIVSKPNSLIRFITSVTIQLFNLRFRMVGSMEEALDLLQKLDPSLPDLSHLAKECVEAKTG